VVDMKEHLENKSIVEYEIPMKDGEIPMHRQGDPFPLVEHDHHGAHRTEVEVRGYSYRA